tara:strand:+ start:1958 stop:2767 length:810 start_codon:yes stop_codon:yes gene_type:complete
MKSLLLLSIAVLTFTPLSQDEQPQNLATIESLRNLKSNSFKVGEKLSYTISYGFIDAGEATISIEKVTKKAGRPVFHAVGLGRSVGMTEWFFKTRDRYESYIDTEAIVPWEFIRDVNEGGYKIKRHLIFDQLQQKVVDKMAPQKGEFTFEPYAQDMLSAFYYARSIKTDTLQPGDMISFTMFLDHEQFPFRLHYLGKEIVKTDFGQVQCLKLRPSLQEGRIFKENEGMTIYVSDDINKVPVLIESELLVGSIKVKLVKTENLIRGLQYR